MGVEKNICHACGGRGKENGCPRCGLTPRSTIQLKTLDLTVNAEIIPPAYQGKLWTKPEVTNDLTKKQVDFDSKLDKVLNTFLSGTIPKFSLYLGAPAKYGKHLFAYSCLQTALVQQFTIAPMLTTSDWRRLYKVSQMNPFYKLYGQYKWDDLISRDVVFMVVDHSDDRFDVVSLLKDILDSRAMFGKPTFIISDYALNELVPAWDKDGFSKIYNPLPDRDYLRYPVIIHRFD